MARRRNALISQREYARRRGVSHSAVQRAITAGRVETIGGKIDPVLADSQWDDNTDRSKPRNRITGDPKHARAHDQPSLPMDLTGSDDGKAKDTGGNGTAAGYAAARAERELYQAQLAKLDLDRRRGDLVRADEVRIAAFNAGRTTRDRLIDLKERLTPALSPEALRLLEEGIEEICRGFSNGNGNGNEPHSDGS